MIFRRRFVLGAAAAMHSLLHAAGERIIDIHQHTNYAGRTDEELIAHQERMGVTKTVLLPAGSMYGLAVGAGGNDSVMAVARRYPQRFVFFANELPDLPQARSVIEKYLKLGAIGIGEQKFGVDAESPPIQKLAEVARDYKVPMLLHFQHGTYNLGFDRFHKVLSRFPGVNFIGHAQTWWGNIDGAVRQEDLYPKGKVAPGGLTDRYLRDYPNMYGDLSAGSGLNALLRDEGHARDFLERHQDKLMYGSDCDDNVGSGEKCSGSRCLEALRRLTSDAVLRKILFTNAGKVMRV